ncbi:MAG: hypothetical protein PHU71_01810 [Candidatus Gracilibacteria bacterium]|nr:hypothetical protein [Candidatus Gracilibacteria bacterium]
MRRKDFLLVGLNIVMLLAIVFLLNISKLTASYDDLSKNDLTIGQQYKKTTISSWENKYANVSENIKNLSSSAALNYAEKFYKSIPADQLSHILADVKEKALLKVIELTLAEEDDKKTKNYYEELVAFSPRNIINLYNYADYLFQREDYEESLDILNSLRELNPSNIKYASLQIKTLAKTGQNAELIKVYEDFLRNNYMYTDYTRIFFASEGEEFDGVRMLPVFNIVVDNEWHIYNLPMDNKEVLPKIINNFRIDPVKRTTVFGIEYIKFIDRQEQEIIKFEYFDDWILTGVRALGNNQFEDIWTSQSIVKHDLDIVTEDIASIELKLKFGPQNFSEEIEAIVKEAYAL